jgi:hypothetical protein
VDRLNVLYLLILHGRSVVSHWISLWALALQTAWGTATARRVQPSHGYEQPCPNPGEDASLPSIRLQFLLPGRRSWRYALVLVITCVAQSKGSIARRPRSSLAFTKIVYKAEGKEHNWPNLCVMIEWRSNVAHETWDKRRSERALHRRVLTPAAVGGTLLKLLSRCRRTRRYDFPFRQKHLRIDYLQITRHSISLYG